MNARIHEGEVVLYRFGNKELPAAMAMAVDLLRRQQPEAAYIAMQVCPHDEDYGDILGGASVMARITSTFDRSWRTK